MSDAGSSPTSTMPRPGGRPVRAANASTAGRTSLRICWATAAPSRSRAGMLRCSLGLEPLERVGAAEHDELVARANGGVRRRVEFHPQILPLDADDHDAEALTQVRIEDRLIRQPRRAGDRDLLHRQLEILRARRQ